MIGMSGLYDMKRLTGGYSDENVYACNPFDFIRHEHDPARLDALRRQDIILAIGHDDPSCDEQPGALRALCGRRGSATRCASGTAGRTTGRIGSR